MAKVLLVNPPFLPKYSRSSRCPAVTKSATIYYPLWLSHAAGLLEKRGHEVLLIDFPAEGKQLEDHRARISAFDPDLIVFESSTPSIESDVAHLAAVRGWFPGRKRTVLVGTHPSAMPAETFALNTAVDIIARREYDWTLCDLAERPDELAAIPGISWRKEGSIIHNPDRSFSENLDEIPFVSSVYKKHLNIGNYFYAHCKNPIVSVFAGRGCPNHCFFCVYPQVMFGHRYRHRSVRHFVDELEYIFRELPEVREVLIDDDNFTADQPFVEKVCDEIIRRKLKVTWTCEARVDLAYDVMVKMKKAGCRMLVAGLESGAQEVLDAVGKGTTAELGRQFVSSAARAGIRVHGCFMAGNRGDTPETLRATLSYALDLNLDTAQFYPLMVYPGTAAYQWADRNGYIKASCFRDWLTSDGMHNCVLSTGSLSATQLVDFCDEARRRFYLRPRYIVRRLYDIMAHPSETGRTVKAAHMLMMNLFRKHR